MSNNEQLALEGIVFGANLPPEPEIIPRDVSSNSYVGKGAVSRYMRQKYEEFIRTSDNARLNPDETFQYPEAKRDVLRKVMRYSQLIGENGRRIPINDASDARIGRTFQNTYNAARRALSEI